MTDKNEQNEKFMRLLTQNTSKICEGDYSVSKEIEKFTNENEYPETIAHLAESFSMMAVKLEAREYNLELNLEELKGKNQKLHEESRTRSDFGYLAIAVIVLLSLYSIILISMHSLLPFEISPSTGHVISLVLQVIFIVIVIAGLKRMKMPLREFGLNFNNIKLALGQSIGFSAIIMIITLGIKYYLVNYSNVFEPGEPLLNFTHIDSVFYTYLIIAPMQEFLARGVIQTTLVRGFSGTYNIFWAILLTSMIHGNFHIHESVSLGIISILMGIAWGYMFYRHKTIIGVSISHFLLGNWVVVLGLWDFILNY